MAFPTSPTDGDTYIDPTTKRKFVYSSANSLWQLRGRSELADYTSLTGTIATPTLGDSLVAAASGTEYEPASQVSNNFQARKTNTPLAYSWGGQVDYPSGALGITTAGDDMVISPSTSTRKTGYVIPRTTYSSTQPGSSGATYNFATGEAFCFSFTLTELMTTGTFYYLTIYNVLQDTNYSSGLYTRVGGALIKGREIDQATLNSALQLQTNDKVLSTGFTFVYTSSTNITIFFRNDNDFTDQFSAGDTLTFVVFKLSNSTSPQDFTFDDWTGTAPTTTSSTWQQVNTVIAPGLTFPAGYTSLTDLSTTGDLSFYAQVYSTLDQGRQYRKPETSVYDFYERRKNQVPDDQNLEILSAPVTPSQSQFLPDKYTIYNSSTSALNYWDSGTSSWIAI